MAEIRVMKPARRRGWMWLVPLLLLLAVGAWFLLDRGGLRQDTARTTDTTSAVSGGAIDTAGGVYAPPAPSPAAVGDTAPGAPPTEKAGEARRGGAARVAAPGPGPGGH
jgi:hypothetical protein